jgi:hypothetical protein
MRFCGSPMRYALSLGRRRRAEQGHSLLFTAAVPTDLGLLPSRDQEGEEIIETFHNDVAKDWRRQPRSGPPVASWIPSA